MTIRHPAPAKAKAKTRPRARCNMHISSLHIPGPRLNQISVYAFFASFVVYSFLFLPSVLLSSHPTLPDYQRIQSTCIFILFYPHHTQSASNQLTFHQLHFSFYVFYPTIRIKFFFQFNTLSYAIPLPISMVPRHFSVFVLFNKHTSFEKSRNLYPIHSFSDERRTTSFLISSLHILDAMSCRASPPCMHACMRKHTSCCM
ncbi:hypothetical protein BDN70DRAFT_166709 [Pholiota conissans]|uniref:Uncharacterized protein n=1 Tax=Pholiota conissans TaxID=109636 RepID=A0A9P5YVE9_9AGAR|nr:hypothetical protein BDN70DRAFT_166709 [Pholiota conissans]